MNTISGVRLKDLFATEALQDHLAVLAESLGFSLGIFERTGTPVYASKNAKSPCGGLHSCSFESTSHCLESCRSLMMKTLQSGEPDVFKCCAGIVSFAFPIDYHDERAVILGHGSFGSYEDFRASLRLAHTAGLESLSVTGPLVFTSFQQAWKTGGFVAAAVKRLLMHSQEALALKNKVEGLKSMVGVWGSAAEERLETLYKYLLSKLSALLDIDSIAILTHDIEQKRYTRLCSLSKSGEPSEVAGIAEDDQIIASLLDGAPYVSSAETEHAPTFDLTGSGGTRYFFPIVVFKKLQGILRIEDRILTENDAQIIIAFCQQTALSIENHRLHQNLYKKFNRFATISDLTKSITPIQNHETLLRTILDLSAELLKAEQGSLMLLDHETEDLILEAKKGIIDGVAGKLRINRGKGIAGKVAELGEAILVENLENDPRIKQKNKKHYKTRSFVSVPLKVDDRIIGVLNLSDKATGEVFDDEDLKLVQSFATHAAIVMERNVFYNKTEELKKLTITDSLTGLLNRRYLNERLRHEVTRSERHGHSLSLLMLDLDGFKHCNDTQGHVYGDMILRKIASTLTATVRSVDIVARYGGDEFMIILPETGESLALDIAERLRSNVAKNLQMPTESEGASPPTLSTSIGIVCYPVHGVTVESLIENADRALYRAKNKGKNRIEVFS